MAEPEVVEIEEKPASGIVKPVVLNQHSWGILLTCDLCNLRFTRKHFLEKHMKTHQKRKPFKCK